MVTFIHDRQFLNRGDVVIVECDHQCNVRVMDDHNFEKFKQGVQHRYYGGFYRILPARIVIPNSGYWNSTLDLGSRHAHVRHAVRYLKSSHVTAA
ncbi:DUF1883 domain-containing protein [Acidisphaera sp. S103]|uniref:DUF1883 domain-containing protein n=1 Tax=Acidisphaera sp. S103 TaxID=1747223 RepID=UPI00131CE8F2